MSAVAVCCCRASLTWACTRVGAGESSRGAWGGQQPRFASFVGAGIGCQGASPACHRGAVRSDDDREIRVFLSWHGLCRTQRFQTAQTRRADMTARLVACVLVMSGVLLYLLRWISRVPAQQPVVSQWGHPVWSHDHDLRSRSRR